MFYVGAYKQIKDLVADLGDPKIVEEMTASKTFLFNKKTLKEMSKLDDAKMLEHAEQGMSVYDMLLTKKLAENCIFDDEVAPQVYDCIDGSDKTAIDTTIPLSLVFSIDSDLLEKISKVLDMDNKTIVSEIIAELKLDDKMACFKTTFDFLERIEAKV